MAIKQLNGTLLPVVALDANSTSQDITVGASSAQSTTIGSATNPASSVVVRLASTTACRIAVAANPTATATSTLIQAGQTEFYEITAGSKIAAIQETAAGKLNITICNPLGV